MVGGRGGGDAGGVDMDIGIAGQGGPQAVGCITRTCLMQTGIHFRGLELGFCSRS